MRQNFRAKKESQEIEPEPLQPPNEALLSPITEAPSQIESKRTTEQPNI